MAVIEPCERLRILFAKGEHVEVNRNIPIRRYFRSCQELIRMANVYFEEKNYENSYVLYAKFIILALEKLKTHPEFNTVTAEQRKANKKELKNAFGRAEKLKLLLKINYENDYKIYQDEQEKIKQIETEKEEKKKREEERKIQEREDARKRMEKEQFELFLAEQKRKELEKERLEIEAEFGEKLKIEKNEPLIPPDFAPPPNLPDSSLPHHSTQTTVMPPTNVAAKPTIDRTLKPVNLTDTYVPPPTKPEQNNHNSIAFNASLTQSKNKYGLRTILSPADLPSKFMKIVHSNTSKNIETCGVLFGKLANEVFVITHVLLPHQSGSSDSCTTTREEDMWEFQDLYDGICLGWIHTHPSQTAFLSSVDLHCHFPYQCLMPESVAIVCSGKYDEIGYFMLTPNHGMDVIGKCRKPGFHPHQKNPALFESCDHVKPTSAGTVEIIDWRKK